MVIYIGSDHRGFELKNGLEKYLASSGYEVIDCGPKEYAEDDDYPDAAIAVAEKVSPDHMFSRGILICGSGVGVSVVANKFPNIRCSLCFSPDHALVARTDDNANVLALPADFLTPEVAAKTVAVWLQTEFNNSPKNSRRIEKITAIEYKFGILK